MIHYNDTLRRKTATMLEGLSLLVHGPAKMGKTTFAETAPGPICVLDAEGGTRFTKTRKTYWDPVKDPPPVDDGTWETCVVYVRDFNTVAYAYQWFASGQHPFKSLVVDSLSEVQQRCVDQLAGSGRMEQQLWGDLLRQMSDIIRKMRDLIIHPTNPLTAVVLVAMTRKNDDRMVPSVQGALQTTLPYYIDVTGYFFTEADPNTGQLVRKLLVAPLPGFEAGDRTGRLPTIIDNPNIISMLDTIFGTAANPTEWTAAVEATPPTTTKDT